MITDDSIRIKLPVILVGMMGSWKSTVGKKLSATLKIDFIDIDDEIEQKTSKSIMEIFKTSGEIYFRELESQFLRNCIVMHENIISTGGGVVLALKNRNVLMNNGYKIYLKASPRVLADRIRNMDKRPLLIQNIPLIAQLTKYCDERDPLYKSVANITLDTDKMTSDEVVNKIINHISRTDEFDQS